MSGRKRYRVALPCSPYAWAALEAPSPMTEAEWAQMLVAVHAMKVGFVVEPEPVGWLDHIAGRIAAPTIDIEREGRDG